MPTLIVGETAIPRKKVIVRVDDEGRIILAPASVGGGGTALTKQDTADSFGLAPGAVAQGSVADKLADVELAVRGSETTNTPTQVAITASTSAVLKTATVGRIRYTIHNTLAASLLVRKAASAASATTYDFEIPPGESYYSEAYEWAGEIRAFSTAAGTVNFSESV